MADCTKPAAYRCRGIFFQKEKKTLSHLSEVYIHPVNSQLQSHAHSTHAHSAPNRQNFLGEVDNPRTRLQRRSLGLYAAGLRALHVNTANPTKDAPDAYSSVVTTTSDTNNPTEKLFVMTSTVLHGAPFTFQLLRHASLTPTGDSSESATWPTQTTMLTIDFPCTGITDPQVWYHAAFTTLLFAGNCVTALLTEKQCTVMNKDVPAFLSFIFAVDICIKH